MHNPGTFIAPIRIRWYALLFVIALIGLPWIGAEPIPFSSVRNYVGGADNVQGLIFFQQRIPRVLLALLVGGLLSVCGASLQVLFRNPLAEPWTLGVAGGASVGAFASHLFPLFAFALGPFTSVQAFALLGAMAALALVWAFARRTTLATTHTLLLAGVTIGIISGGIIMLMIYFVSPYQFVSFHRWMMGGLDVLGYRDFGPILLLGIPGLTVLGAMAKAYNHLALGEELALGHGVDVRRVQQYTFCGAGLVTAACVAVAGPIAFVGMIIPHAVRRLSGFDHRLVMPASFLLGGVVLALCDSLARTMLAPTEIPVGVITAVLGGPAFLYILTRR